MLVDRRYYDAPVTYHVRLLCIIAINDNEQVYVAGQSASKNNMLGKITKSKTKPNKKAAERSALFSPQRKSSPIPSPKRPEPSITSPRYRQGRELRGGRRDLALSTWPMKIVKAEKAQQGARLHAHLEASSRSLESVSAPTGPDRTDSSADAAWARRSPWSIRYACLLPTIGLTKSGMAAVWFGCFWPQNLSSLGFASVRDVFAGPLF